MPTFALEKQMRLQWKQTCFILTLPVVGAVAATEKYTKKEVTLNVQLFPIHIV